MSSIELIKDTLHREVTLKKKPSLAFLLGNLFAGGVVGYVIDFSSPKKHTYDKKIFVDLYKPDILPKKWLVRNDNFLNLTVSLPYTNHFYIRTNNRRRSAEFGFFGLSSGLEYYTQPNNYLSMQMGIALDYPAPVPASIHYDEAYQIATAVFSNLRYAVRREKIHVGAGLSYQYLRWKYIDNSLGSNITIARNNHGLGLSLAAHYNTAKYFYVGVVYQPLVVNLSDNTFDYQHFLAMEFVYKIPLKRNTIFDH